MSLNWNLSAIKDNESLCWVNKGPGEDGEDEHEMHPVTHALIWATMAVDLGEITEKNWQEFWARVAVHEEVCGAFIFQHEKGKGPEPVFITPEQVKAHIGLTTNVRSLKETAWGSRLGGLLVNRKQERVARLRRETPKEPAAIGSTLDLVG